MSENYSFYIYCLIAVVAGFFILKRIASCLFRSLIILAILAALALIYFTHFTPPA